jgi:hypothetical protein
MYLSVQKMIGGDTFRSISEQLDLASVIVLLCSNLSLGCGFRTVPRLGPATRNTAWPKVSYMVSKMHAKIL